MSKNEYGNPEDHWLDIFKSLKIDTVPSEYVRSITISFNDGQVWEIDLNKNPQTFDIDEAIEELIENYHEDINNIDFQVNTEKVKKDITRKTSTFIKNNVK